MHYTDKCIFCESEKYQNPFKTRSVYHISKIRTFPRRTEPRNARLGLKPVFFHHRGHLAET
jgi:hypothetical protein